MEMSRFLCQRCRRAEDSVHFHKKLFLYQISIRFTDDDARNINRTGNGRVAYENYVIQILTTSHKHAHIESETENQDDMTKHVTEDEDNKRREENLLTIKLKRGLR